MSHFRVIGDQFQWEDCFEISVFMKKKFAYRHHLVGSARVPMSDFFSCQEPRELTFALHKDGRENNRGEILATLQFEVNHGKSIAADKLAPGDYRRIVVQLINLVVLNTLQELPKGAEYVCPSAILSHCALISLPV